MRLAPPTTGSADRPLPRHGAKKAWESVAESVHRNLRNVFKGLKGGKEAEITCAQSA
jgi:hypothetical protein